MNTKIEYLEMIKKNGFYFIKIHNSLNEILFHKNNLSDNTFSGWFPISCFIFNGQIFLIKCTIKKEWVLWELNEKYEYINHKLTPQEIYSYDKELIYFIESILSPLSVVNNRIDNSYKMNFILNSLNLELIIPNWIRCINLNDKDSYVRLLESNINIKNTLIFFDSVATCFSNSNDEFNNKIPYKFRELTKKIRYQEYALLKNEFYIEDIFGGECFLVNRSIVLNSQKIAYLCKSKSFSYYIFCSGELGIFTHIYIPHINLVIYKNEDNYKDGFLESKGNIKSLLERLYNIEESNSIFIKKNKIDSCLITGVNHGNMYHLLVNDIAGISRIYNYPSKEYNFNVAYTKSISLLGLNSDFIEKITSTFSSNFHKIDTSSSIDRLNNKYFCTFLRANYHVDERIRREIIASIIERVRLLQQSQNKWDEKKILLIGIRAGRRRWLNQIEGIISLVNKINYMIPNLLVIFDGTGSVEFDSNNNEHIFSEKIIVDSILEKTKNVDSISLIGKPVFLSIYAALQSSFYIAPWGAGLTKYQILADKVGIVHTNKSVIESFTELYYSWERDNMPYIYYSEPIDSLDFKEDSSNVPEDNRPDWKLFYNYQVDEENIFELVKKLL